MKRASVTLTNLAVGYSRKQPILSHISCTVSGGVLVALLGRNGTGKTTLLKTLAGHLERHEGKIEVDGCELSSFSVRCRAQHIAYSPSHLQFEPLTTVHELIELGRFATRGWLTASSRTDQLAIKSAAEATRITHLLNSHLAEISDGERQRASIAMALAQEASLLLLDEPMAFLDFLAKRELIALLHYVAHTQERIILYATHDLQLAHHYADRFLWVEDGTLREVNREFVNKLLVSTVKYADINK